MFYMLCLQDFTFVGVGGSAVVFLLLQNCCILHFTFAAFYVCVGQWHLMFCILHLQHFTFVGVGGIAVAQSLGHFYITFTFYLSKLLHFTFAAFYILWVGGIAVAQSLGHFSRFPPRGCQEIKWGQE